MTKGIEYFTEIFFFYGLLFCGFFFEMWKASKDAQKKKVHLQLVEKTLSDNMKKLARLRRHLDETFTLVENNKT